MCTKQIEYHFPPLRGGYTFQATYAKSREFEINIYTTTNYFISIQTRILSLKSELHKTHKKCTPTQISFYQLSLALFRRLNFNSDEPSLETITVLEQMIFTRRQSNFQICKNNLLKIGNNTTANKLYPLSNQILLADLNLTFLQYKKRSKTRFLKFGKT